jgi:DNA-binding transcriptional LysR family regulator
MNASGPGSGKDPSGRFSPPHVGSATEGGGGRVKSTIVLIFGCSGNLASTRLMPAIARFNARVPLGRRIRVVGVDVKPPSKPPRSLGLLFVRGDLLEEETYRRLAGALREMGSPEK